MTTGDAQALLSAVIANPDDDAAALAYAAYLTSQDDPRGEFITTQVRLSQPINPVRRRAAVERERTLLQEHRKEFSDPTSSVLPNYSSWSFRRGFVDEIRCSTVVTAEFLDDLQTLLEIEPIRRMYLQLASTAQLERLLDDGVIGRLLTLSLQGAVGAGGATRLAESAQLSSLQKLLLPDCGVGDAGVAALANSPHLRAHSLTLAGNDIGDAGAEHIARSLRLADCRALYLRDNSIGRDGLHALTTSEQLRGLTTLSLSSNPLNEHAELLLADDAFPNLARLELFHVTPPDDVKERMHTRWGDRLHAEWHP